MISSSTFDVFLCHASKDKVVVRDLAGRLRNNGVIVWFDEQDGDHPRALDQGLSNSRRLLIVYSASFEDSWGLHEYLAFRANLDSSTAIEKVLILRLDATPLHGLLHAFRRVQWHPETGVEAVLRFCKKALSDFNTLGNEGLNSEPGFSAQVKHTPAIQPATQKQLAAVRAYPENFLEDEFRLTLLFDTDLVPSSQHPQWVDHWKHYEVKVALAEVVLADGKPMMLAFPSQIGVLLINQRPAQTIVRAKPHLLPHDIGSTGLCFEVLELIEAQPVGPGISPKQTGNSVAAPAIGKKKRWPAQLLDLLRDILPETH